MQGRCSNVFVLGFHMFVLLGQVSTFLKTCISRLPWPSCSKKHPSLPFKNLCRDVLTASHVLEKWRVTFHYAGRSNIPRSFRVAVCGADLVSLPENPWKSYTWATPMGSSMMCQMVMCWFIVEILPIMAFAMVWRSWKLLCYLPLWMAEVFFRFPLPRLEQPKKSGWQRGSFGSVASSVIYMFQTTDRQHWTLFFPAKYSDLALLVPH